MGGRQPGLRGDLGSRARPEGWPFERWCQQPKTEGLRSWTCVDPCCGSVMSGLTDKGRMLKGSSIVTLQQGSKAKGRMTVSGRAQQAKRHMRVGKAQAPSCLSTAGKHFSATATWHTRQSRLQIAGRSVVRCVCALHCYRQRIQGLQHGSRQQTAGSPDLLN